MNLAEYEIGSLGFLQENCIKNLPIAWSHYQVLLDNLASLNCEDFRTIVNSLPPYSIQQYSTTFLTISQKKFFHSVLSMIIQKYMWGNETSQVLNIIPKEIGLPFYEVSTDLGLPPILVYAGYVLYNWSYKDPNQPFSLENIKPNYILCHTYSQEWFMKIHMATEAQGSKALSSMLKIKKYIVEGNNPKIKKSLKKVISAIKGCSDVIGRMPEHCIPKDLHKFTRYFGGTNYPDLFPNGLQIEGASHKPIILKKITGGQSTTIHSFDAFFSIKHEGHGKELLEEMVNYMPIAHQKFLRDLRGGISLTNYVEKCQDNELIDLFQKGINSLKHLRQTHFDFLHRYTAKPNQNKVSEKEGLFINDSFKIRLQAILNDTRIARDSFLQKKKNVCRSKSVLMPNIFLRGILVAVLLSYFIFVLYNT